MHGPVVTSLGGGDDESREHLRSLLLDPRPGVAVTPRPVRTLVPGRAEGVLVGGNLTVLAASAGTPLGWPSAESLAVLEDVGEPPYRLDRALTQLLRSGWFDRVRGVVVGDLTDCGPEQEVLAVLTDRLVPLGVPTVVGAPVGHARRNLAFGLGSSAVLDADRGTLTQRAAPLR